jgi:hypothetical protein
MFRALQIKIQDHIHASEKDLLVIISLCSRLELFSARLPQYPTLKTRLKPPLQVMVPATPTSVKSQSKQKTTKRLTYQDIAVQAKGDPFNWFSNFWQTHINNTVVWPVSPQQQDRVAVLCKQLTDFYVLADPQLVNKVISNSLQTAGRVSCWVSCRVSCWVSCSRLP